MAEQQTDVIIIGGGMVGLTLAAGLADSGFSVAVVEARQPPSWDAAHTSNRVSAITHTSRRILERVGAWDFITSRRVSPFEAIRAWDAADHPGVTFDAADRGEACLGHIVENTLIQDALREAVVRRAGVSLYCPVAVDELDAADEGVRVRLGDGRRLRGRLLVGADGASSMVREHAGIRVRERDYGQRGIVATITTEHHHGAVARQRFLPEGPLALLPLADGRCSIVWSADNARAAELQTLSDREFNTALTGASEAVLGQVTASVDRASFPLRRLHAETYVAPRVALVGDAAHVIHPLAGQGVNLGFLDAAALVDVMAEARERGRDPFGFGVLRRYARWRRGDNVLMQSAMDGFHWLFSNDDPWRSLLRNAGLGVTDRLAPAKALFVDQAVGHRGDLPSLACR